jgi:hypothetical protein
MFRLAICRGLSAILAERSQPLLVRSLRTAFPQSAVFLTQEHEIFGFDDRI